MTAEIHSILNGIPTTYKELAMVLTFFVSKNEKWIIV